MDNEGGEYVMDDGRERERVDWMVEMESIDKCFPWRFDKYIIHIHTHTHIHTFTHTYLASSWP